MGATVQVWHRMTISGHVAQTSSEGGALLDLTVILIRIASMHMVHQTFCYALDLMAVTK